MIVLCKPHPNPSPTACAKALVLLRSIITAKDEAVAQGEGLRFTSI